MANKQAKEPGRVEVVVDDEVKVVDPAIAENIDDLAAINEANRSGAPVSYDDVRKELGLA